jgi:hypothetical protein
MWYLPRTDDCGWHKVLHTPFRGIFGYNLSCCLYVAHWQSDAESVVVGTLHRSSLLLDESRSGMNAWVIAKLQESVNANGTQYFKNVNLVEVDNVCDGGLEMYKVLQQRAPENMHLD